MLRARACADPANACFMCADVLLAAYLAPSRYRPTFRRFATSSQRDIKVEIRDGVAIVRLDTQNSKVI